MPRKSASNQRSKGKSTKKTQVSRSQKASVTFPVGRIGRHMRRLRLAERLGGSAPVFMAGVLDYLVSEMLEGAGLVAEQHKPNQQKYPKIKPRHL